MELAISLELYHLLPSKRALKLSGLNLHFNLILIFAVERILLHFNTFIAGCRLTMREWFARIIPVFTNHLYLYCVFAAFLKNKLIGTNVL